MPSSAPCRTAMTCNSTPTLAKIDYRARGLSSPMGYTMRTHALNHLYTLVYKSHTLHSSILVPGDAGLHPFVDKDYVSDDGDHVRSMQTKWAGEQAALEDAGTVLHNLLTGEWPVVRRRNTSKSPDTQGEPPRSNACSGCASLPRIGRSTEVGMPVQDLQGYKPSAARLLRPPCLDRNAQVEP